MLSQASGLECPPDPTEDGEVPEYDDDFEDDFEDDDEDGDDSDTVVEPQESPTKTVRAGPVANLTTFLVLCCGPMS